MQKSTKKNNKSKGNAPKTKQQPPRPKNVSIPAGFSRVTQSGGPRLTTRGDGVVVTHREYFGDLHCSTTFTVQQSIVVNPGLHTSFPWLGLMANNYEFYRFHKLELEYVPLVGSSVGGSVMMAIELDVADDAPFNKQKMMTYRTCSQGPCWAPSKITVPSADLHRFAEKLFTRPGPVPSGKDQKTYDVGTMYVATDAGTSVTTGSLFLNYVCELSCPHVPTLYPWEFSGKIQTGGGSSKAAPLLNATYTSANPAVPVLEAVDNTQFKVSVPGEYLIDMIWSGTGILASNLTTVLSRVAGDAVISDITSLVNAGATTNQILGKIVLRVPSIIAVTTALFTTVTDINFRMAPFKSTL